LSRKYESWKSNLITRNSAKKGNLCLRNNKLPVEYIGSLALRCVTRERILAAYPDLDTQDIVFSVRYILEKEQEEKINKIRCSEHNKGVRVRFRNAFKTDVKYSTYFYRRYSEVPEDVLVLKTKSKIANPGDVYRQLKEQDLLSFEGVKVIVRCDGIFRGSFLGVSDR